MKEIFHEKAERLRWLREEKDSKGNYHYSGTIAYAPLENKDGSKKKKDISKREANRLFSRNRKEHFDGKKSNSNIYKTKMRRTDKELSFEETFVSAVNVSKSPESLTLGEFLSFGFRFFSGYSFFDYKGITFDKLKNTNPIQFFKNAGFLNFYDELKHGFTFWHYRDVLFCKDTTPKSEFLLFFDLYKFLLKPNFTKFRENNFIDFVKLLEVKDKENEGTKLVSEIFLQEREWKERCKKTDWQGTGNKKFEDSITDLSIYLAKEWVEISDKENISQTDYFRIKSKDYTINGESIFEYQLTNNFKNANLKGAEKHKDFWEKLDK